MRNTEPQQCRKAPVSLLGTPPANARLAQICLPIGAPGPGTLPRFGRKVESSQQPKGDRKRSTDKTKRRSRYMVDTFALPLMLIRKWFGDRAFDRVLMSQMS